MPWGARRPCARRPAAVPGRTSTANRTATRASRTITSGGSASSPSSTAGTAPSTEFSIGTHPASTRPSRTAASTAGLPTHGTSSAPDDSGSDRSACSVNVACGPRNASRATVGEPRTTVLSSAGAVVPSGQQPEPGQLARPAPARDQRRSGTAARARPRRPARRASRSPRPAPSPSVLRSAASHVVARERPGHGDQQVERCRAGRAPRRRRRGRPRAARGSVNPRPASTTTRTKSSTSLTDGTSDARGPPQRSFGRAAVVGDPAHRVQPGRGAFGVVVGGSPRLDHRHHVLGHELRHPLQPDGVDVRRRGRLDRARGEQARPGEHRGQRLGHRPEAGVDDERHVDRAGRGGPGQLA